MDLIMRSSDSDRELAAFEHSIALPMQNLLGVGDALFHLGTGSGFVGTVYLGTFRKRPKATSYLAHIA